MEMCELGSLVIVIVVLFVLVNNIVHNIPAPFDGGRIIVHEEWIEPICGGNQSYICNPVKDKLFAPLFFRA